MRVSSRKSKVQFRKYNVLNPRYEKLSTTNTHEGQMSTLSPSSTEAYRGSDMEDIPFLMQPPLLHNSIDTSTSVLQDQTIAECLPLLKGVNSHTDIFASTGDPLIYDENGLLKLRRKQHFKFLYGALLEYPPGWVGVDASRPWMIYWALLALHLLGEDVTRYRGQLVKSLFPLQNKTGGYGGGQGHTSHLAGTYAAILSIAMVGGDAAWSLTDRHAIWEWLGRLKQPDGGFRVCEGGEEDVRGAYCALVVIALLDLPWELPPESAARNRGLTTFGDNLGRYLSRCQTYEGGISASPGNEAHGSYTFCVLACLCLLAPPHEMRNWIDIEQLLNWMSARQYAPEGGFTGRTNKLVDGCYSHWLGGCWPLLQAALDGPMPKTTTTSRTGPDATEHPPANLYSEEGLARYILNCCQNPHGGLRDKPSKPPDSYHTCYTLAGVSTTEHFHYYEHDGDQSRFASAFNWHAIRAEKRRQRSIASDNFIDVEENFEAGCKLNAVHPIFVTPHAAVNNMRMWAVQQPKLI